MTTSVFAREQHTSETRANTITRLSTKSPICSLHLSDFQPGDPQELKEEEERAPRPSIKSPGGVIPRRSRNAAWGSSFARQAFGAWLQFPYNLDAS